MAARAGLHGIPVTPQKRGSCDASIKRLEIGCFQLPAAGAGDGIELEPAQLAMLLSGIDPRTARRRKRFQLPGRVPAGA
jgi:hypothetical protein